MPSHAAAHAARAVPSPVPANAPSPEPRTAAATRKRFKHGLYGQSPVLPNEDHAAYAAFREAMFEDLAPSHPFEASLVEQVVNAQWTLQRLWAGEAGVHEQYQAHHDVGGVSVGRSIAVAGMWDADGTRELDRMSRAQQRVFNQFHRALRTLPLVREQLRKGLLGPNTASDSNDGASAHGADRGDAPTPVAAVPHPEQRPVSAAVDTVVSAPARIAEVPVSPAEAASPSTDVASAPVADRQPTHGASRAEHRPTAPRERPERPFMAADADLERLETEAEQLEAWIEQQARDLAGLPSHRRRAAS